MNPSATRLAPRREIIIQINAISSVAQIIISTNSINPTAARDRTSWPPLRLQGWSPVGVNIIVGVVLVFIHLIISYALSDSRNG